MIISRRFIRFCSVGAVNTAVDVGCYLLLMHVGWPVVAANFVSTLCGLLVSYQLHSRFTFRSRPAVRKTVAFIAVTCTGLWLVQPLVIYGLRHVVAAALLQKLAAVAVGLMWNYSWYRSVVFASKPAGPPGS